MTSPNVLTEIFQIICYLVANHLYDLRDYLLYTRQQLCRHVSKGTNTRINCYERS